MATTFDCNYKPGETLFQAKSYPVSEQFSFTSVKCHQVEAIIKNMSPNKASGIDKTPMRVIRDCLQAISHPLTSIIKSVNPKISRIGRQKRNNEFFPIWLKDPFWLTILGNDIKRFDILFLSSKFAKLQNSATGL